MVVDGRQVVVCSGRRRWFPVEVREGKGHKETSRETGGGSDWRGVVVVVEDGKVEGVGGGGDGRGAGAGASTGKTVGRAKAERGRVRASMAVLWFGKRRAEDERRGDTQMGRGGGSVV